jgi:hypothetical protein
LYFSIKLLLHQGTKLWASNFHDWVQYLNQLPLNPKHILQRDIYLQNLLSTNWYIRLWDAGSHIMLNLDCFSFSVRIIVIVWSPFLKVRNF